LIIPSLWSRLYFGCIHVISGALEIISSEWPLRLEGRGMCLTNTVQLIDFDNLNPQRQKKLDSMHKKIKARRDDLQKKVDELNAGLKKLEGAKGRSARKTRR
jgi:hypothetical protein